MWPVVSHYSLSRVTSPMEHRQITNISSICGQCNGQYLGWRLGRYISQESVKYQSSLDQYLASSRVSTDALTAWWPAFQPSIDCYHQSRLPVRHIISSTFSIKNRLSLIVLVNIVLNRTVVVSDWRFYNLCGSHLQSQSELYHVPYYILVTYYILWLLIWLLNKVKMLLVIYCQFSSRSLVVSFASSRQQVEMKWSTIN